MNTQTYYTANEVKPRVREFWGNFKKVDYQQAVSSLEVPPYSKNELVSDNMSVCL